MMPDHAKEFALLVQEVRAGSTEATHAFVSKYARHLQRAVRRRLNARLRARFDTQDFVQAVWASFFARLPTVRFVEQPHVALRFLERLVRNKLVDEHRRCLQTEKRDLRREIGVDDLAVTRVVGRRPPRPSEIAAAREEYSRLLNGSPAHYQRILELRLTGESVVQIGRRLQMNERTIRRVLLRFAHRWKRSSAHGHDR
jgi:RNA polymerase sigma factor (sigma-70 family)